MQFSAFEVQTHTHAHASCNIMQKFTNIEGTQRTKIELHREKSQDVDTCQISNLTFENSK